MQKNFIFVKTRKTAGTSVEIALSSHAGDADVVTPISPDDEIVRYKSTPDALPRNFSTNAAGEIEYRQSIASEDEEAVSRAYRTHVKPHIVFFNHMRIAEIRNHIDESFWNNAYKFTVERHPYEKAVSQAYYKARRNPNVDFTTFLDAIVRSGGYANFGSYAINGTIAVDFVIQHATLADDIKRVESALGGIDILSRLPVTKGQYRTDRRPAREILNESQKALIQQRCAREFELFGYEP